MTCIVPCCQNAKPYPESTFCRKHWFMIPLEVRGEFWATGTFIGTPDPPRRAKAVERALEHIAEQSRG